MELAIMIILICAWICITLEIKRVKSELWETTEDLHRRLDAIEKRQNKTQGLIMKQIKYED
jgi:hypothetical protein